MAGTTIVATTAGAVVLLYYVLRRKSSIKMEDDDDKSGEEYSNRLARRRLSRRPLAEAPATWFQTIVMLSETLRFTYSETLGKWPIGDLAFGINYLIRRQGNQQVASVYAGEGSVELKGPEIIALLYHYLKLLILCYLFSKKQFAVFLSSTGFSQADVLLQKPKAGLLKPAFTILRDKYSKCFLLLIRGTHSIKDTLTAATGVVVPFHHSVLRDGGISNLVLGHAHCGMVGAARWIAKLCTPVLLDALIKKPHYEIKIVGHSLGGGTAALLTYILRERKELSSVTCITFAPAACMTWELAESGKHFISTIINGSDLVPTFSATSVDGLRSEVTASAWLNDLRNQIEDNRVLNVIYRSATALGSRLPSIAKAKAKVVSAGALLHPVSSSTKVVMKRAQDVAQAVVRTRTSLSSWSCIAPRRRVVQASSNSISGDLPEAPLITERTSVSSVCDVITGEPKANDVDHTSSSGCSADETEEEEEEEEEEGFVEVDRAIASSSLEHLAEGEVWYELEKKLQGQESDSDIQAQVEEEAAMVEEITEEEKVLAAAVESHTTISSSDVADNLQFYPPGRIMHMISVPSSLANGFGHDGTMKEHVGIYETPRKLYGKLRLSKTMISDHYMPMYKNVMEQLIAELEGLED